MVVVTLGAVLSPSGRTLRPSGHVDRKAIIGASIALVGLSPFAGMSAHAATGSASRPSIHVLGDSLTADGAAWLRAAAKPTRLRIDAKQSRHAFQGVALLRKVRPLPRTIVFALGSNDDWDSWGRTSFKRRIKEVFAVAGPSRCVVWVNFYQRPTAAQARRHVMLFSGLNDELARAAKTRRNLRVVDWAALAARNPRWFRYDEMHPLDAGYRARARAIVSAIRACQ